MPCSFSCASMPTRMCCLGVRAIGGRSSLIETGAESFQLVQAPVMLVLIPATSSILFFYVLFSTSLLLVFSRFAFATPEQQKEASDLADLFTFR